MLALSLAQAKNIAIVVVVILVVIALLTAKFVASVTKKALLLLVLAAVALGVWTQRQSLQTCADNVRDRAPGTVATCSFFGNDITIKAP
jgi:protein-S-isoprenylcysteine O-methyltransferase Ste14